MANWLDWTYLLFLVVIVSTWGWYDFRAFLKKAAATSADVLSAEYRKTIIFHLCLLGLLVALWLTFGRAWDVLGFATPNWSGQDWIGVMLAAGVLVGISLNFVAAATSAKSDTARLKAYRGLEAFLPKTPRQHRWGMLVSVSAGVIEEIVYRGFVIWLLAQVMPIYSALAAQAVIFGVIHVYQGWTGVLSTGVIGAVYGVIFWATGSLLLPILLHILTDMAALTSVYIVFHRSETSTAVV